MYRLLGEQFRSTLAYAFAQFLIGEKQGSLFTRSISKGDLPGVGVAPSGFRQAPPQFNPTRVRVERTLITCSECQCRISADVVYRIIDMFSVYSCVRYPFS